MKRNYLITKIGNSLFATIPNKLAKQLGLHAGDQVYYELIPGKKKIILNLVTHSAQSSTASLNKKDSLWLKQNAGSLTIK
jgi:antitoxin component of MazEF toxin-antitoxin module